MKGAKMTLRGLAALAAALALLLALPALASAQPGALDRGFGEAGRVATQTSLGGPLWTEAKAQVAQGQDGTVLAASGGTLFRYLPDGSLDPSFGEGGRVTVAEPEGRPFSISDLAVDSQGRAVLFGDVEVPGIRVPIDYLGASVHPTLAAIARYDRSGQPDPSFDGDGFLITDFDLPAYAPSHYDSAFVAFAGGALDEEGNVVGILSVTDALPCSVRGSASARRRMLVRMTPDGRLDARFSEDGILADIGFVHIGHLAIGGGELVLAGEKEGPCEKAPDFAVARLLADGTPDTSFGRNGFRSRLLGPISDLAVDRAGGLLLLAGRGLLRLTGRGKVNRRFGDRGRSYVRLPGDSILSAVAIEPSGRIVLAGTQALARAAEEPVGDPYRRAFTVLRLTQSGKPDRSFGHHGWVATRFGKRSNASASEAFVDQAGRLVAGGTIASPELAPTGGIAIARYLLER
jgi:uncharacterized delta-60 repeat protein